MKKQIATFRSGLILASALLTAAGYISANQPVDSSTGSPAQQPTAVVFQFAPQSESTTDTMALSSQACADYNSNASAAAAPSSVTVDPKLQDKISNELQKKLSKINIPVMVNPDPETIPVGSVVVTGCLFQAQKGNAAERMIGLGLGASRLGAHVVVDSKTETGFARVDSFDVQVKGRAILPPVGPAGVAVHAIREPRETLSADAKKLSDKIVKKLDGDLKQQVPAVKAS